MPSEAVNLGSEIRQEFRPVEPKALAAFATGFRVGAWCGRRAGGAARLLHVAKFAKNFGLGSRKPWRLSLQVFELVRGASVERAEPLDYFK